MKRRLKILCSCIITICLLVLSLKYLTDLMELKRSDIKYTPFFEQDENFDVLFMGSSHVINAVYPMELWNDYGIVSYNMGSHSSVLATTYWVMENALEYTTPKLVVIDCLGLSLNTKSSDKFSFVHHSLDAFPLSKTKLSAIRDLLDDPVMDEMQRKGTTREIKNRTSIELLWNYSVYHTRWAELTEDDFAVPYTKEKGAEYRIAVATPNEILDVPAGSKLEGETTGTKYLRKMIEDCQDRGIDVLLIYLPFPATENQHKDANRVYDIAEEYGVNYINFLDMDIVNYYTDCYDENSHLNPSGACKVTEYLGQYIIENYDISDQRINSAYNDWFEDYSEYTSYKAALLQNQTKLNTYLMLLADKSYDVILEINNPDIWGKRKYVRLLSNLGVDADMITENTDFLVIEAGGKEVNYLNDLRHSDTGISTMLGTFRFVSNAVKSDGYGSQYTMYLNGKELYSITSEQTANPHIRITVMDKDTKEVIGQSGFSL